MLVGEALLAPLHLQVMALPFNLITLSGLLALKNLKPYFLSVAFFDTPEQGIERNRILWQRHRFGESGVFLPVSGRWQIQQGFEGKLTHKGLWQHALDFVAVDSNNKIFKDRGFELTDYFAFGQDVLSPMQGTVVACLSTDLDNGIGQVANTRNWGNYVILRSVSGLCVTLAHLKKDSVLVKLGEFVQVGQKIAQVGNSGYSQEPHLHMQAHWYPAVGAYTTPFHLLNFCIENHAHFHRVPIANEIVYSTPVNHAVEKALNFKVNEPMIFKFTDKNSKKESRVSINTLVDEISGAFYLTDGISRLHFAKVGWQFYFYGLEGSHSSPLWDVLAAAPKIPMTYGQKLNFVDELPARLVLNPFSRLLANILQIFRGTRESATARYCLNEQGLEITGVCRLSGRENKTYFKIDPLMGIQEFSVGSKCYERTT
jgi:murein DD-endopeptidase MepM/ murein hydrolase activator NlpD